MKIKIIVMTDDEQVLAQAEATSFESAEEALGKLDRFSQTKGEVLQNRLEEGLPIYDGKAYCKDCKAKVGLHDCDNCGYCSTDESVMARGQK